MADIGQITMKNQIFTVGAKAPKRAKNPAGVNIYRGASDGIRMVNPARGRGLEKKAVKSIVAILPVSGEVAFWDGHGWTYTRALAARINQSDARKMANEAGEQNKRPCRHFNYNTSPADIVDMLRAAERAGVL